MAAKGKTSGEQSLLQRVVRRMGPQAMLDALDAEQRLTLPFMWRLVGRPSQFAPHGDWRWWLNSAGRGYGKTRGGAEWLREEARAMPGARFAIVGQTPEDVRSIQIEGDSGILAVSPANERPEWKPGLGELRWPNGAIGQVLSGANPEEARGPQFHRAWVDELAKMPRARALFDNLNMGLRLVYERNPDKVEPRGLITTTPRPIAVLRDLRKKKSTVVTGGSTYDNAPNLARSYLDDMLASYEGTRLGRQELHGEQLEDTPGALWQRAMFDRHGFRRRGDVTEFDVIAIAIDPSVSNNEDGTSAETGIIAGGVKFAAGARRQFHVMRDASLRGTPGERARAAIRLFVELEADCFVVETNNGGDWIPAMLDAEWRLLKLDPSWAAVLPGSPPIRTVTATRGKHVRAEPIATLYEQTGTVTHEGVMEELEDQLVSWSPLLNERSPDRLDALVWLLTYLSTAKPNVRV